jgi:hypothetical protein
MLIGYMRVSTGEQNLDLQRALFSYGGFSGQALSFDSVAAM